MTGLLSRCFRTSFAARFDCLAALVSRVSSALLLAIAVSVAMAQSSESMVLAEHTPLQVLRGSAVPVGHYNPAQKLRLAIAIRPPHLAEEEEFLRNLQDRASPDFHQFLSPEEWNARFAPSAEDEQAVVDWAESQGLTVTSRYNHRLVVDVEAPAGVIEKAFGVTLNNYWFRGETDFSNDRDPVIPARLGAVVRSVLGLNNIQRLRDSRPGPPLKGADYSQGPAYAVTAQGRSDARPVARPDTDGNPSSASSLLTNGNLNPTGLYSSQVYNYDGLQALGHCCNPLNNSAGPPITSNIAIFSLAEFSASDIQGFQSTYPYLAMNWTEVAVDGTIDCSDPQNSCPDLEADMDLEWSAATANSFGSANDTSHIYVYTGGTNTFATSADIFSHMLNDNYARVVTSSWGCAEIYCYGTGAMDSVHAVLNSMIGQGWTVINASGDGGAAADCTDESVGYPASDTDVLAAGGTELQVDSNDVWQSEQGWQGGFDNDDCFFNIGGSTGGVSSYYQLPSWQDRLGGTYRQVPDLALNALGIGQNFYFNGRLVCCSNGTSVVAPELAGFFAQENSYLTSIGSFCGASDTSACSPIGNPAPLIYDIGFYNEISHYPFYDQTTGCNDNDATVTYNLGYYCAGPGYDQVTGWGSANLLQLAWDLNWALIPAYGMPTVTWSGPATGKWYNSNKKAVWGIVDHGGGTFHGTGIAGFTQGWDSLPPDSSSRPHGGTGDSFYSGPQFPNTVYGCLSLTGADGCGQGVAQGCHTIHIRGWNNQGLTTGLVTYGPLCYDSTAPTTSIGFAGSPPGGNGWYVTPVLVSLTGSDPGAFSGTGSGIAATYYALDNSDCTSSALSNCQTYSAPFTLSTPGAHVLYYFSQDNAGNWETNRNVSYIKLDLGAPVTTAKVSSSAPQSHGWYNTRVGVTLSATDPNGPGVQTTYISINNASCQAKASMLSNCAVYFPLGVNLTRNGVNTLTYFSMDSSGNLETLHSASIKIDTVPPQTFALVSAKGTGGNYSGPVVVTLKATDNASGVESTWFSLNGNGPIQYTRPITISYRGAVTVSFYSIDVAGNREATGSVSFRDF